MFLLNLTTNGSHADVLSRTVGGPVFVYIPSSTSAADRTSL